MRKKSFLIFLMLVISGVLFYFVYKKIGVREIWNSLLSFSPKGIIVTLVIMCLSHLIGILRWRMILKDRVKEVKFKNLITPWLVGFGFTFFAPFSFIVSETMRAYSLKQKEKYISWKKSITSVLIDKFFEGTTSFLVIFLGIISLIVYSLTIPFKVWLFFLFLLIPIGSIVFFYVNAFKSQSMTKIFEKPLKKLLNHRVKNVFEIEKEIFDFFKIHNKNMRKAAALALLRQVVDFFACWSILIFMGTKLSIFQATSVIGFVYLSFYIIPVPVALGVLELIEALTFSQLGLSPQIGVAFTLLYRSFFFIFAVLGIFLGFKSIIILFSKNISEVSKKENVP